MLPENPHKKTGLTRLYGSVKNSLSGLKLAFQEEEAFRLEVYATLLLGPIIYFIDLEIEMPVKMMQTIITQARSSDCQVIVSHHDYSGTPDKESLQNLI